MKVPQPRELRNVVGCPKVIRDTTGFSDGQLERELGCPFWRETSFGEDDNSRD